MAQKEVIEIEAKTGQAEKDIENLTKEVQNLSKAQEDTAKSTESIASSFSALTKGAVIGLAIKAFEAFTEVLNNNQRVADFFATSLEAVSIVFNDLVSFILDNSGKVIDVFRAIFEDPLGAIKDLGEIIKNNLIERFESLIDTVSLLGKGFVKFFSGDFVGAAELAGQASKEFVDVLTGVDNTVDKVVETTAEAVGAIAQYTSETIKSAKANVELQKTAERSAVINQGLIEKYDRLAEQQRQIRDEERNTLEERIAANEELNRILDEQEKLMLANANNILSSAQAQYDKNQSQENEIALLEAQNELLAVQAQIEGFRSEQKANDLALSREQKQLDLDRSQTEIDNLRTIEEAKIELFENEVARNEAQLQLEEQLFNKQLQLINERLAAEKEGSVAYAEILNERQTLNAEYEATKISLGKASRDAEVSTATEGINQLKGILGEASAAGKALSIAEAVINTYQGATKALAQGGIFGPVLAGINVAVGLANVKKIVDTPLPDFFSGSAPAVSVPSGPTVGANVSAPSFNIQAAQQQTALLNDISQATQMPARAYVVSKDISSAQELDRNRIKNATI